MRGERGNTPPNHPKTQNFNQPQKSSKMTHEILTIKDSLVRIKNDVNGNPRYVLHFLQMFSGVENDRLRGAFSIEERYAMAVARAKHIGGRKYSTKSYGGGVVFQSYNTDELAKKIRSLQLYTEVSKEAAARLNRIAQEVRQELEKMNQ